MTIRARFSPGLGEGRCMRLGRIGIIAFAPPTTPIDLNDLSYTLTATGATCSSYYETNVVKVNMTDRKKNRFSTLY